VGAVLWASQSQGFNPVSLFVLGLALGFMAWVYLSTEYIVSDSGVLVRSGPVRRWIDPTLAGSPCANPALRSSLIS
jgi:hypothetical protein